MGAGVSPRYTREEARVNVYVYTNVYVCTKEQTVYTKEQTDVDRKNKELVSGPASGLSSGGSVWLEQRAQKTRPQTRGLHSPTVQLNLSALYRIGGPRRGCVARVTGALGGV